MIESVIFARNYIKDVYVPADAVVGEGRRLAEHTYAVDGSSQRYRSAAY